jgi:hypothetical protein
VLDDSISGQTNGFYVARRELFCQLRSPPHFGCADRGEIRRVAEKERPIIPDPIMKLD